MSPVIIRPHRSTTYVYALIVTDRAALSVGRSVLSHYSEPCKNGCTDRDAVWVEDSDGPKEPCIRWGPDPPWEGAILRGKRASHIVKYRDTLRSCAKTAEPIEMTFGLWARMGRRNHELDGVRRC